MKNLGWMKAEVFHSAQCTLTERYLHGREYGVSHW
jgi:hypothetical protein